MQHMGVNRELAKQKLRGEVQVFLIWLILNVFLVNGVMISASLRGLKALLLWTWALSNFKPQLKQ